jgi:hypothetical protein
MSRFLLLTVCAFGLLFSSALANAQRESGNYMGGFAGTGILGSIPKRDVCTWSISPGEKAWCQQQAQPQQVRKPIRRR